MNKLNLPTFELLCDVETNLPYGYRITVETDTEKHIVCLHICDNDTEVLEKNNRKLFVDALSFSNVNDTYKRYFEPFLSTYPAPLFLEELMNCADEILDYAKENLQNTYKYLIIAKKTDNDTASSESSSDSQNSAAMG